MCYRACSNEQCIRQHKNNKTIFFNKWPSTGCLDAHQVKSLFASIIHLYLKDIKVYHMGRTRPFQMWLVTHHRHCWSIHCSVVQTTDITISLFLKTGLLKIWIELLNLHINSYAMEYKEFKLAYLQGGFTFTILYSVKKCIYKMKLAAAWKLPWMFGFNLYSGIFQEWIEKKHQVDWYWSKEGTDGSLRSNTGAIVDSRASQIWIAGLDYQVLLT